MVSKQQGTIVLILMQQNVVIIRHISDDVSKIFVGYLVIQVFMKNNLFKLNQQHLSRDMWWIIHHNNYLINWFGIL